MKKIIIWGASGHARVVADIIRLAKCYEIAGFLDDTVSSHGKKFCGSKIIGGREKLEQFLKAGVKDLIVAVGDCDARLGLSQIALKKGFRLATVIHPKAVVAQGVRVEEGSVVCAGAIINSGAKISRNVIVNTGASVDHECKLSDGVHVGPGARLGGKVSVGKGAWIGIGAIVKDRVSIGKRSIIGAGAVVVDDVPAGVLSYGVPAKVIRALEKTKGSLGKA